jgi:hypothetical protein
VRRVREVLIDREGEPAQNVARGGDHGCEGLLMLVTGAIQIVQRELNASSGCRSGGSSREELLEPGSDERCRREGCPSHGFVSGDLDRLQPAPDARNRSRDRFDFRALTKGFSSGLRAEERGEPESLSEKVASAHLLPEGFGTTLSLDCAHFSIHHTTPVRVEPPSSGIARLPLA